MKHLKAMEGGRETAFVKQAPKGTHLRMKPSFLMSLLQSSRWSYCSWGGGGVKHLTAFYPTYSQSCTDINMTLFRWLPQGTWNCVPLFTQTHPETNRLRAGPALDGNSGWTADRKQGFLPSCSLVYTQDCILSSLGKERPTKEGEGGGKKVVVHLHNLGFWKLKVLITLLILYWNEKTAYQQIQLPARCPG